MVELQREFPGFTIIKKRDSSLHRAIHYALVTLTFGQMRAYLDGYQTTLGARVYVTDDWESRPDDERYVTLRHEAVHMRQFRRYTWPGMVLMYLFLPLPMGLAWGRARLEQEAYAESMRAAADVWGKAAVAHHEFREHIIAQFTGPSYGWMWPFPRSLARWYDGVLGSIA